MNKKTQTYALLVAAIDIGTTYSGWAYSLRSDFEKDPTRVYCRHWNSSYGKAPTSVLLKKAGETLTVESFGYLAESDYAQLDTYTDYYFFRRFKMALYKNKGFNRSLELEDANGKKLQALLVFKLTIEYLKNDLIADNKKRYDGARSDDIRWVITVPAIWSNAAKQFMREAAEQAGIDSKKLLIALEPEAASLYFRHLALVKTSTASKDSFHTLKPGTKYMVLDAGGGTIDIVIHEIRTDGTIREIYKAGGGNWGGVTVDEAYRQFLVKIFGEDRMEQMRNESFEQYNDIFLEFEDKKRHISPQKSFRLKVPWEFFPEMTSERLKNIISASEFAGRVSCHPGKLQVDADVAAGFFEAAVNDIVVRVAELLQKPEVKDISHILLAGGFSEAKILESSIRVTCSKVKVVVPDCAGLAVLKGAVIFGHSPTTVAERVCRYTYGVAVIRKFEENTHPKELKIEVAGESFCKNIFSIHVRAGQTVRIGEAQLEARYENKRGCDSIYLYATSDPNPAYTTDPGCFKIGKVHVPGAENHGGFKVKMKYGGTEMNVEIRSVNTGERVNGTVAFLG